MLAATEHVKYLGKLLDLVNPNNEDIEARIAKGWEPFDGFRQQLCKKSIAMKRHMQLFEAVVTSFSLFEMSARTMAAEWQAKLRSAQNKMLRQMCGKQWFQAGEPIEEDVSTDAV